MGPLKGEDSSSVKMGTILVNSGILGGVLGCSTPPPPQIPKALQNLVKLKPIVKTVLKIAEFRMPTPQHVRKKGSKILKLPPVCNCFTLAMTNKLVVIINSLLSAKN